MFVKGSICVVLDVFKPLLRDAFWFTKGCVSSNLLHLTFYLRQFHYWIMFVKILRPTESPTNSSAVVEDHPTSLGWRNPSLLPPTLMLMILWNNVPYILTDF